MAVPCFYKNCFNQQRVGTSCSFFELPKDERRVIWVKHSGNSSLCTEKGKIKICEKHFFENDIIVSGSRKRLVPTAIPSSSTGICNCTEQLTDKSCLLLGVSQRGVLNLKRAVSEDDETFV